jgi:hypothetical protein
LPAGELRAKMHRTPLLLFVDSLATRAFPSYLSELALCRLSLARGTDSFAVFFAWDATLRRAWSCVAFWSAWFGLSSEQAAGRVSTFPSTVSRSSSAASGLCASSPLSFLLESEVSVKGRWRVSGGPRTAGRKKKSVISDSKIDARSRPNQQPPLRSISYSRVLLSAEPCSGREALRDESGMGTEGRGEGMNQHLALSHRSPCATLFSKSY